MALLGAVCISFPKNIIAKPYIIIPLLYQIIIANYKQSSQEKIMAPARNEAEEEESSDDDDDEMEVTKNEAGEDGEEEECTDLSNS